MIPSAQQQYLCEHICAGRHFEGEHVSIVYLNPSKSALDRDGAPVRWSALHTEHPSFARCTDPRQPLSPRHKDLKVLDAKDIPVVQT